MLGLHSCVQAFSCCAESGLPSGWAVWASHRGGLSGCRAQSSMHVGSVVVVVREPSCPWGCMGVFLVWVSNPYPLHSLADAQPLNHQRSPKAHLNSLLLSVALSQDTNKWKLAKVLKEQFGNI